MIDSPRGESSFVTGSLKIYHEARDGAPIDVLVEKTMRPERLGLNASTLRSRMSKLGIQRK